MAEVYRSFRITKGGDTIDVNVLSDGTIKSSTDKISMPNHSNAENFFASMQRLAGGIANIFRKNPNKAVETRHNAKHHV